MLLGMSWDALWGELGLLIKLLEKGFCVPNTMVVFLYLY